MKGHIEKRGDRSWRITVSAGRDPVTGRRVRVRRTIHGTKRDAERALDRIISELAQDATLEPSRLTLAQWIRDWLDEGARTWSPTTHDRYRRLMDKHVLPAIGGIRLCDLQPLHIQRRLIDPLTTSGLSPTTVHNCYRALRSALQRAVELRMLRRSPMDGVRPPRPKSRSNAALMPEQVAAIVRAAQASQWWLPILVAASTGMRRGEVLGLRWSDIDWTEGIAHVQQTVHEVAGKLLFRGPKSGRPRAVYLDQELLDLLREHRRAQAERRLRAGPAWEDHGLVFAGERGQALSPIRFSKAFSRYARAAGVDGARLHDLRHTHLSALIAEGWPVTAVAERAGHATPHVTTQIYAHVMPGLQRDLMRARVPNLSPKTANRGDTLEG